MELIKPAIQEGVPSAGVIRLGGALHNGDDIILRTVGDTDVMLSNSGTLFAGNVQLAGNADATILSTTSIVLVNTAFTATRTYTLPLANSVWAGHSIQIIDLNGGNWNYTFPLIVARAGSDFVWWGSTTTVTLQRGFRSYEFVSDGVSRWSMTYPNLVQEMGTTIGSGAASQGQLGEYIESTVAEGSAVGLTSNVDTNVTTISLTAGDWDVFGIAKFVGAAGTVLHQCYGIVTTTSASLPANSIDAFAFPDLNFTLGAFRCGFPVPTKRFGFSSTTTVYLVVNAVFGTSTLGGWGRISARRMR